ncbi:TonB-dependent receptor domain-containing protein [Brevundimonas diminuta]|uniref:TonB-dependent receptor domain-containing protein n=1 Tax=Brevundimonas diminuta TaxID=293 RepID=UPI0037CC1A2A
MGLKGRFLDRTLTVDTSVFNIEWEDIQLQNTSASNLVYLMNGGSARSRGVEAAVQWAPGGGWVVSANATVTDAELTEDLPTPPTGTALLGKKGTPLPFTPDFTSNLGVEKSFDLRHGYRLTLGANWSHVGERNTLLRSGTAPVARRGELRLPAHDVVDLRANLSNGEWDLTAYIRNLGSEYGLLNVDDRQGAVATTNATFIAPRTVGFSLARSF